jgi:protein-disulfide isomerase
MRASALALITALSCTGTQAPAAPQASAAPTADACADPLPEVVATVAGKPITRAELQTEGAGPLLEARMQLYQARRSALDSMIVDQLIDAELEARSMTESELLEAEVNGKLTEPSDEQIATFYEENQRQMQGPLEVMKPQIAAYLQNQQAGELTRAFLASLEDKYEVQRHIEPLRVDVKAGDSARMGPKDAPITIIEFSDFQCPYCTSAAATVKEVREAYGDKVSIVYRHFPLPMHPQAGKAAEAAECAGDQGEFWAYHDMLFADQKAWSQDDLTGYAKELGLKMKPFEACLASGEKAAVVANDMEEGRAVGMSGTPGFYVNGMVLSGAQPFGAFAELIDAELKRLGK